MEFVRGGVWIVFLGTFRKIRGLSDFGGKFLNQYLFLSTKWG